MDWSLGMSTKYESTDALGEDLLAGSFCGRTLQE